MVLVWFATVAHAQSAEPTDDETTREAELFGPSAPVPEPVAPVAPAPASSPDDLLGGGFQSAEADIGNRLTALDERLTFGGRLWQETVATVPEGVDGPDQIALAAPNLLDLFADARPNDRVRAYARARLQHDWSIRSDAVDPFTGEPLPQDSILLDQLWAKFDVAHHLYVTAGRQRIRWGASRFWNPTDFLNQQRLDPLAVLDLRTGVDLLKLHVPIERANANLYAVANLGDAQALDQIGGAVRAEWAFGQSEITTSAAFRKDQAERLGADLSSGLGPFDIHLEGAALHGVTEPLWTGTLDLDTLTVPTETERPQDWQLQVVAGIELTLRIGADDTVVVGVEGFHNGLGYEDASLYEWLLLQGQFVPLYLGRDYGAAYLLVAGPGSWDDQTFLASLLGNLSDRSFASRIEWRGTVLTWLEPTIYAQYHFGERGELHYSLDVPAVPGIPGLEEGISVPAPLLDVGLGAIVRF